MPDPRPTVTTTGEHRDEAQHLLDEADHANTPAEVELLAAALAAAEARGAERVRRLVASTAERHRRAQVLHADNAIKALLGHQPSLQGAMSAAWAREEGLVARALEDIAGTAR